MAFTKLVFRPGINRDITSYSNEGGWHDCDKIRFQKGFPEQIGGWQKYTNSSFVGTCRALMSWVSLSRNNYLGVGTSKKYYIEFGGDFYDITPIRKTTVGAATFAAVDGSDVLTVTDNNFGGQAGDYVTFSSAVSLGGDITADVLNAEFEIATVIDSDSYTIVSPVVATASDTGDGGASVDAAYQINIGLDTAVVGTGWGTDTWGADGWGLPSEAPVITSTLRLWSHDNYGEDLLFNARDGGLYYWDATTGVTTRAVALSSLSGANTTPTVAKQILVSDRDRHVIAFGCDDEFTPGVQDPMLIRFSNQESLVDWASSPENTAGSLRLGSGSEIVTAVETRQQVLVFTDTTLYAMQYLGPPFTFGVTTVSESITIISPNAAVAVQDKVFWMGRNEFYVYTGAVQRLPCAVRDYIFDDLDTSQIEKIFAGVNSEHAEVWWFYPSLSGGGANDKYVIYNYDENVWSYGALARSAWLDRGIRDYPIAAGLDGYLYDQENGLNDGSTNPSTAISAFIQSSPMDIGEGDQFLFISRMIPDVTFKNSTATIPSVNLTLSVRNFSDGTYFDSSTQEYVKTQSAPVDQRTEQLFFRLRGRQMSFKLSSNERNVTWRLGSPRVDIIQDGMR